MVTAWVVCTTRDGTRLSPGSGIACSSSVAFQDTQASLRAGPPGSGALPALAARPLGERPGSWLPGEAAGEGRQARCGLGTGHGAAVAAGQHLGLEPDQRGDGLLGRWPVPGGDIRRPGDPTSAASLAPLGQAARRPVPGCAALRVRLPGRGRCQLPTHRSPPSRGSRRREEPRGRPGACAATARRGSAWRGPAHRRRRGDREGAVPG